MKMTTASAGPDSIGAGAPAPSDTITPAMIEAEGDVLTCPHCHRSWEVDQRILRAILDELRGWDRRFDGPETLARQILDLISMAQTECQTQSPAPTTRAHRDIS